MLSTFIAFYEILLLKLDKIAVCPQPKFKIKAVMSLYTTVWACVTGCWQFSQPICCYQQCLARKAQYNSDLDHKVAQAEKDRYQNPGNPEGNSWQSCGSSLYSATCIWPSDPISHTRVAFLQLTIGQITINTLQYSVLLYQSPPGVTPIEGLLMTKWRHYEDSQSRGLLTLKWILHIVIA